MKSQSSSKGRCVLITGASSGFGLLTAVTLAQRGWRVLATMRDLSKIGMLAAVAKIAGVFDQIEFHVLDVTKSEQVNALAVMFEKRRMRLDAIINNAGSAMVGFAEDVTDSELRQQLDVNFFGAVAVTRAFLPRLRQQGSGHIVMVSSISGRMGFPGIGSYVASKFALEGWAESLRFELKSLGIQVVLVEPGAFETEIWTRNAILSAGTRNTQSPNAARVALWRRHLSTGVPKGNPQIVADKISKILDTPSPKLRYVLGKDARLSLLFRHWLPWGVFERRLMRHNGMDVDPG